MLITVIEFVRVCARVCVRVFSLIHETNKWIWNTNEKYAYGPYMDKHTNVARARGSLTRIYAYAAGMKFRDMFKRFKKYSLKF